MKVSAILLIKDEEDLLRICLDSISNLVDEIIVVDTGSSDNSLDIASEYTNKLFLVDEISDFGKLRNEVMAITENEWVLSFDGDFVMIPLEGDAIRLSAIEAEALNINKVLFPMFEFTTSLPYITGVYYKGWLYKKSEYYWAKPFGEELTPLVIETGMYTNRAIIHHYRWLKSPESIRKRHIEYERFGVWTVSQEEGAKELSPADYMELVNRLYGFDSKPIRTVSYKEAFGSQRIFLAPNQGNVYKYVGPLVEEVMMLPWIRKEEK